jgi:hypothetical protein
MIKQLHGGVGGGGEVVFLSFSLVSYMFMTVHACG